MIDDESETDKLKLIRQVSPLCVQVGLIRRTTYRWSCVDLTW